MPNARLRANFSNFAKQFHSKWRSSGCMELSFALHFVNIKQKIDVDGFNQVWVIE